MARKRKAATLSVDINANVAKLSTDMGKAVSILGGFERSVAKIGKAMKLLIPVATIGAGIVTLTKFNNEMKRLADLGEAAGSVADAFKNFGGSASEIEKARKATLGLVDSFTLMEVANKGLLANVKGFGENFSQVADFSARVADTLNLDTTESLRRLTDAISKGAVKELKTFGFVLENSKDKAKIAAQVFEQLPTQLARLAPLGDSVSNAMTAVSTALDEGQKRMGMVINSNDEVTKTLRELEKTIQEIDWEELGKNSAEAFATMLRAAQIALPWIIEHVSESVRAFNELFGIGLQARIDRTAQKLVGLQEQLASGLDLNQFSQQTNILGHAPNAALDALQKERGENKVAQQIRETEAELQNLVSQQNKLGVSSKAVGEAVSTFGDILGGSGGAADDTAKKFKELQDRWDKLLSSKQESSIKGQLETAINNLDSSAFTKLTDQFRTSVQDGFVAEWQDAIDGGVVSLDDVMAQANVEGQNVVDKLTEDFKQKSEEAYRSGIETWRGLFENAITGVTFDLSSALRQVAVGFAAQMAQSMLGSLGGLNISGPADIGGLLASQLMGAATGGGGGAGGLMSSIGMGAGAGGLIGSFGMSAGAAQAAGIAGPAMANGMFASGTGMLGALGPYGVAALVAGGLIASNMDKVEKLFGGGGVTHKETVARHDFAGWMEDEIGKLSTIGLFDSQGKMQSQDASKFNFLEGSPDKFNSGTWADDFKAQGDKVLNVFSGLGEGLEEVLDITEDVGGQMGFLLGENLLFNIDNARLMVQQLGLSFGDLEEGLVEAGRKGEMTWHAVEVAIQGASEAFKPGLEAIGDVKGAVDTLAESGGSGIRALKAVRDIATETLEAGGKTLQDMHDLMLSQGVEAGLAQDIMDGIKQRGLGTLESIMEGTDRVIGGVVADIASGNEELRQSWEDMGDQIKGLTDDLQAMDSHLKKELTIDVMTNLDDSTQDALNAGVFEGTGIDSALSRAKSIGTPNTALSRNISSGQSGNVAASARANLAPVTINMDLRNAQAGVGAEVTQALTSMESRIVQRTLNAVYDAKSRGAM